MLYNIDDIIIETQNEKTGLVSITYDPFYLFVFTLYNIKHESVSNTKINFFCESIEPLSKYINRNSKKEGHISYEAIVKLIYDLGLIIKTLENSNKSILCFSIDDIVVINNETFLFINTHKILDINSKKFISLNKPINLKTSFLTPDVEWNVLPIKLFYTSPYYSLADMIFYLIIGEKWNGDIKLLHPIIGTKLSNFLLRCFEKDPIKRKLLYV